MEELKKNKKFPIYILVCLIVSSIMFGVNLSLLIIRIVFHIYTINHYYIICALLITLTLFVINHKAENSLACLWDECHLKEILEIKWQFLEIKYDIKSYI